MRILLDTHALIWAAIEPHRLSARVRDILEDRGNEILVSAVSGYEIELKRDREPGLRSVPDDLERAVIARDFGWLSVSAAHAIAAGRLPRLHGDPFERLLVAQATIERASLITVDARIAPYGAPTIW